MTQSTDIQAQLARAIGMSERIRALLATDCYVYEAEGMEHILAALTSARDFIASLPPSVNLRGASTPTDSTVKEALEIVEEYIVDRDARGSMRTETLETIRAALVGLNNAACDLKEAVIVARAYVRGGRYEEALKALDKANNPKEHQNNEGERN